MASEIVSSIEETAPTMHSIEPMAEVNGATRDNLDAGAPRPAQLLTPEKTPDGKKLTTPDEEQLKLPEEKKLKFPDHLTDQVKQALQAVAHAQPESRNAQVHSLAPPQNDATPQLTSETPSLADSDAQTDGNIEAPPEFADAQSESTAIQIGATIQAPSVDPPANDETFTHIIRPLQPGRPAPQQAPGNCWDHLESFPENVNRAAWLPYVEALGLTQNVFPEIRVEGKKPQRGDKGNWKKNPSWSFMAYILIAVSPEGKLEQNVVYNLGLAWCPRISAVNQTCRKALSQENEFRLDKPFYRLARADEPMKKCVEKKIAAKGKGRTTKKTTPKGNSKKRPSPTLSSGKKTAPENDIAKSSRPSSGKKTASKSSSQSSSSPTTSLSPSSSLSSNNPPRQDSAWNPINANSRSQSSDRLPAPSQSATGRPSRTIKRPAKYQEEPSSGTDEDEQENGSPAPQPPRKRIRFTSKSQILPGCKIASEEAPNSGPGAQTTGCREYNEDSSSCDKPSDVSTSVEEENGDPGPQMAACQERDQASSSSSTDERSDEYGSYSKTDPTYGSGVVMKEGFPHGTHSKLNLYFQRQNRVEEEARDEAAAKAEAAIKRLADRREAIWKTEGYAAVEPAANGENFRVTSAKDAGIQTPLLRGKEEIKPVKYMNDVINLARKKGKLGEWLATDLEERFYGNKMKGRRRVQRDAIMIERLNESSRLYLGRPETKLQPYGQFSASNPMGEQFSESNVRGV